jgi:HEAT repeat protein
MGALQSEETRVRWTAAYALGEMGPPAQPAIPALLHTLSDTNEQVRGSASYSLSVVCGSPVSGLVAALGQGDAMGRKAAARQLGDIAVELRKATPVLARMAQSDSPEVRAQALETLGMLRPQEGLVLSTLLKGLNDPEVDVRLAALRALARPGWNAQKVVPKLTECLNDPSTVVQTNAAQALANYGSAVQK